jgi:CspA family cold shock protein
MQGIIKKKTDKGFGFIAVEGEPKDIFFHTNSLVGISFDELREGDKVEFNVDKDGAKGPAAIDVKVMA